MNALVTYQKRDAVTNIVSISSRITYHLYSSSRSISKLTQLYLYPISSFVVCVYVCLCGEMYVEVIARDLLTQNTCQDAITCSFELRLETCVVSSGSDSIVMMCVLLI